MAWAVYPMIRLPPGLPIARTGAPSFNTIVGDIEERGRLPGASALAIGMPSVWVWKLKSVNSLLSRKPCTINRDPKAFSIVVVIDATFPKLSTIEIWDVDGNSMLSSSAQSIAWSNAGFPGATSSRAASPPSSLARSAR